MFRRPGELNAIRKHRELTNLVYAGFYIKPVGRKECPVRADKDYCWTKFNLLKREAKAPKISDWN